MINPIKNLIELNVRQVLYKLESTIILRDPSENEAKLGFLSYKILESALLSIAKAAYEDAINISDNTGCDENYCSSRIIEKIRERAKQLGEKE